MFGQIKAGTTGAANLVHIFHWPTLTVTFREELWLHVGYSFWSTCQSGFWEMPKLIIINLFMRLVDKLDSLTGMSDNSIAFSTQTCPRMAGNISITLSTNFHSPFLKYSIIHDYLKNLFNMFNNCSFIVFWCFVILSSSFLCFVSPCGAHRNNNDNCTRTQNLIMKLWGFSCWFTAPGHTRTLP